MRRTFALATVALLAIAAPAGAITFGEPDGDAHPRCTNSSVGVAYQFRIDTEVAQDFIADNL